MLLIRALTDVVSRRAIVAGNEDGTIVTLHTGTTNTDGVTPHDLSVVSTHPPGSASVGGVVVPLLLGHPTVHGFDATPLLARSPEDILTVRAARVDKPAVRSPLVGVALGVGRDSRVPYHGPDANRCSGLVVGSDVVLWSVLGVSGGKCNGDDGEN